MSWIYNVCTTCHHEGSTMTRYSMTFYVWSRFASQMPSSELVLPNLSRPQLWNRLQGACAPRAPWRGGSTMQILHIGLVCTWYLMHSHAFRADLAGAYFFWWSWPPGRHTIPIRSTTWPDVCWQVHQFQQWLACPGSAAIDKYGLATLWSCLKPSLQPLSCECWSNCISLGLSSEHSRTLS